MTDLDPELKKQLNDLIVSLLKNAQDAGAWAKTQIPILVQERIAFGRAWETALLLVCLAAGVGLVWGWRKWARWDAPDDDAQVLTGVFGLALPSILVAVATVKQLHDVLLVWFAPRLYIVEWLMDLVKKARS